jgi:hypothetical protein
MSLLHVSKNSHIVIAGGDPGAVAIGIMQRCGRLSFETGASHPPQDEAEIAQNLFLTLRRPRSGRLEGRGPSRCNIDPPVMFAAMGHAP